MPKAVDGGHIRDDRRPAFCFQTHDALDALRARYSADGKKPYGKLATALGVYLVVTEAANRNGGSAARDGFREERKAIAELAGMSPDTFDRYVAVFEEIGLLNVTRQKVGNVNLPNLWALVNPPRVEQPPSRVDAATPGRVGAALRARDSFSEEELPPEEEPPLSPPDADAVDLTVPPAVWLDGKQNLPLDALCDVCGIDPKSPRMTQAIITLNGRGRTVGLRALYWVECCRYAEGSGMEDELAGLHAEPEVFARLLAERIRRKAAALMERDHWRTSLDPKLLRDQWLDLELRRADQGMTADDIRRFGAAVEGMDANALRALATGTPT